MKKIIFFLVALFLIVTVSATELTFKQNEVVNYRFRCLDENNNYCSSATALVISIENSEGGNVFDNISLTYNPTYYNISLPTTVLGEYKALIIAPGNNQTLSEFPYEVTATGKVASSILDNNILIMFGISAIILIAIGVYFSSAWFGFIGSVVLILGGVNLMIYGFNNATDLYTRAIALIFIGVGFIFMFFSAYEWWGNSQGEDE